jgi:hypothetical protein
MRDIKGGTNQGEAYATLFEMVWTYPTKAPRGIGLKWGNKSD